MSEPLPEKFGRFRVVSELGRGAMGVVYEGYDPLIERAVAIKVLRLDEANTQLDAELRLRFRSPAGPSRNATCTRRASSRKRAPRAA
jgi:serine/threonine-protein kinase